MSLNIKCAICDGDGRHLLEFNKFPRSSVFVNKNSTIKNPEPIDLVLSECIVCGHLYLNNLYDVTIYDQSYSYKTNIYESNNYSPLDFEIQTYLILEKIIHECNIKSVLEIGANDLTFLKNLKFNGKKIAVDPILKVNDCSNIDSYSLIADDVPDSILKSCDLIISRHNLEHIQNPEYFIARAARNANKNTLFFVEVPDAEKMIENSRFDQIFLEHLHYFTEKSLVNLFSKFGFSVLLSWKNNRYGGSLCVIFKIIPKHSFIKNDVLLNNNFKNIIDKFQLFKNKCNYLSEQLENNRGNFYGYGAGHSTPFLSYHINYGFNLLEGIFDENYRKTFLKILGITSPIISTNLIHDNFKILITVTDHTNSITKKFDSTKNLYGLLI